MEKVTLQFIAHARNGGELVFKPRNRKVRPDGYAEVPCTLKRNPVDGNKFVAIRENKMGENLKAENETAWAVLGSAEIKRIACLYHGCIFHGHQVCEKGREEHFGVDSFDRYRMTILKEVA